MSVLKHRLKFVMNFARKPVQVTLPAGMDALTGEAVCGNADLPANGIYVLKVQE